MAVFGRVLRAAIILIGVAILATLLVVTSFGGRTKHVTADSNTVSMAGSAFSAPLITISAGDTITWTNNDVAVHDVTSMNGDWGSGILQPGASFAYTFTDPGTYTYQCSVHPFMVGTVVVQPGVGD